MTLLFRVWAQAVSRFASACCFERAVPPVASVIRHHAVTRIG
jgi:hypothetical protein